MRSSLQCGVAMRASPAVCDHVMRAENEDLMGWLLSSVMAARDLQLRLSSAAATKRCEPAWLQVVIVVLHDDEGGDNDDDDENKGLVNWLKLAPTLLRRCHALLKPNFHS